MATITINGKTYYGNSVSITNGNVVIDGVSHSQDGKVSGVVEIKITDGILENLKTDASVFCGQVKGNVIAGGSVNCDDVNGDVMAGGSVNCNDIGGSVQAGGSIVHG